MISAYGHIGFLASLAVPLVVSGAGGISAREPSTFTITAASGYGVEDCLSEGGECGRVVANAWCEEHGRGEALKFGRSGASTDPAAARPYFIVCGD
jgi:hypothetical protein